MCYFETKNDHCHLYATCLLLNFVRYPLGEQCEASEGFVVEIEDVVHLYFGYNQCVALGQRIDVEECVIALILGYFVRGNLPRYDA